MRESPVCALPTLSSALAKDRWSGVAATLWRWIAGVVLFNLLAAGAAMAEPERLRTCVEGVDMKIRYGDVVDCSIDVVGDSDIFRFSGHANEVIILTLSDMTGCVFFDCPGADLFAPGGALLGSFVGPESKSIRLPSSGIFTLSVYELNNDQTEHYRVGLERLFPPSPTASPIEFGTVITETIDPIPDQDFYPFDAFAGAKIALTLSDLTGCVFFDCPGATIYGPDGKSLAEFVGPQSITAETRLEGKYLVHVYELNNDQLETYSLGLQCIVPPPGKAACWRETPTCNGLTATIVGTEDDDVIQGTEGDDVIVGLGGNDVINGKGGNDIICGGPGADTLIGGDGDDQLFGDDGDDVLLGGLGNDTLHGNKGRDSLFGGPGTDTLFGDEDNDVLDGGDGDDVLDGGPGGADVCQTGDTVPPKRCEIRDPL